jgi:CRP/FNR family transcriptional regulator, cyclic AMP receptor protein
MSGRIGLDERRARLHELSLFSACTRRELGRIASLCSPAVVDQGTRLTEQGRFGHEFFVLVDGRVSVWRNGDRVTTLGRGGIFGEMSLLSGLTRSATVVADTDCSLLVVSRAEFYPLLEAAPPVAAGIMRELSLRLRRTMEPSVGRSTPHRLHLQPA